MSNWIKCTTAMPEIVANHYSERVLIWRTMRNATGSINLGYIDDLGWRNDRGTLYIAEGFVITHWRPLPEPPTPEEM